MRNIEFETDDLKSHTVKVIISVKGWIEPYGETKSRSFLAAVQNHINKEERG